MIEAPHNCKFIDQALFSILGSKGVLFWKSLDCKMFQICNSFDFIDRCEISFSKFSDWLEKFMKSFLIDAFWEVKYPDLDDCDVRRIKTVELIVGSWELDSNFFRMNIFLNKKIKYLLEIDSFELEIKVNLCSEHFLWLVCWSTACNDVILGQSQNYEVSRVGVLGKVALN